MRERCVSGRADTGGSGADSVIGRVVLTCRFSTTRHRRSRAVRIPLRLVKRRSSVRIRQGAQRATPDELQLWPSGGSIVGLGHLVRGRLRERMAQCARCSCWTGQPCAACSPGGRAGPPHPRSPGRPCGSRVVYVSEVMPIDEWPSISLIECRSAPAGASGPLMMRPAARQLSALLHDSVVDLATTGSAPVGCPRGALRSRASESIASRRRRRCHELRCRPWTGSIGWRI